MIHCAAVRLIEGGIDISLMHVNKALREPAKNKRPAKFILGGFLVAFKKKVQRLLNLFPFVTPSGFKPETF